MMKAQILYGLKGQGFNDGEINRRFIEALQIPDQESLFNVPEPPPDPKLVLESEKLDIERSKLEFEMMKFSYEMAKIQSEIIKNLAEAEAKEIGPQLDQYKAEMQAMVQMTSRIQQQRGGANENNQE
jgi:hypothetical protein